MSVFLTARQVVAIHDLESGQPVRDAGALEGALARASATWAGQPLHPDAIDQAAIVLIAICQAQAFVDGNKRTAWITCDVTLRLNGVELGDIHDDDILNLFLGISTHRITENAVARWLAARAIVIA